MPRTRRRSSVLPFPALAALPLLALHACIGGDGDDSTPISVATQPMELVFCRARVGDTFSRSEIALRSAQLLGDRRVPERAGRELHVRLHPDGTHVVFARERQSGDASSRELFVSTIDGSEPEQRLTQNASADDEPCWSPDGSTILFATERDHDRRLYACAADGTDQRPFLAALPGEADGQPDWHRGTDRIVFARRAGSSPQRLWLVNGNGTGAVVLTTPPANSLGDFEPAFAPDGSRVAFVRRTAADRGQLVAIELASGLEQTLVDPHGDVRLPRWSPVDERIFCGVSQPDAGRDGVRLAVLRSPGEQPWLVQPGREWLLDGLDVLPTMAPPRAGQNARMLDVRQAEIQVASGVPVSGNRDELGAWDDVPLVLATTQFQLREVAGINCRVDLQVPDALDVVALEVRIRARVTRGDGDSALRSSLYDPHEERFDTVVEIASPGSGYHEMRFLTQSLAHVSRQRQVRFTVIGDLAPGAPAELHVDYVAVTVLPAARASGPTASAPASLGR